MKFYILPYKIASSSAKILAEAMQALRLKRPTKAKLKKEDVVINWGYRGTVDNALLIPTLVNSPPKVGVASSKLRTLNKLKDAGIRIPEFTQDRDEAMSWLASGKPVLARLVLNGSSGEGIIGPLLVADDLPHAPLYVKYIKKSHEYRVHVIKDECLLLQKKKRRGEDVNYHIRSHLNGWVFCSADDDPLKPRLVELAKAAVRSLELDFGAVDIIYNSHYDAAYVLEVNTAPGIERKSTIEFYSSTFNSLYGGSKNDD